MSTLAPQVYAAINAVQTAMSKEGIAKNRRNTQGSGYNFRGVDDVMNALASHLAEAKLMIVPRAISKDCVERQSKSGGALFYTTVKMEFDFVCATDGSKHTACMFGEAMDSGDKSCNKAASAAFKYACFQTFCIPTEGENDADGSTHDVAPATKVVPIEPPKPLSSATEKILRFLAGAPKTRGFIEQVMTAKQFSDIAEFSEETALKTIAWIEKETKSL